MRTSFRLYQTITGAVVLFFGEQDMMANRLRQTKALLCGIILMMLFSPSARAADGTAVWTNYFTASNLDYANAIGLDSSGNVLVTGYTVSSFATIK